MELGLVAVSPEQPSKRNANNLRVAEGPRLDVGTHGKSVRRPTLPHNSGGRVRRTIRVVNSASELGHARYCP